MPAMRTPTRATASRSLVVLLTCAGILAAVATIAQLYGFSTLAVTRGAAQSWIDGHGLYAFRSAAGQAGTALSPPAALLTAPAALLPLAVAGWLLALAGVAALALALIVHAGPAARRHGRRTWPVVLAVGALGLTLEPIRAAIGLGTLDLLVYGLISADLVALRRAARPDRPGREVPCGGRWAGAGIGLATAVSPGSAFFVLYLLVSARPRAALVAAGTAAAAFLPALAVMPHETGAWFGEVLWRIDRGGPVEAIGNQSLAGVLARIYESSATPVLLWMSCAALLTAVGMIRARAAHADGDEAAAFTLTGLTAASVGPVTGTHELVWVLPAMVVLCEAAARSRARTRSSGPRRLPQPTLAGAAAAVVFLLFVLAPIWSLPDALWQNAYALALILLINTLPWRTPPLRGS